MVGRTEGEVVKAALELLDEEESESLDIAERVESRVTRKQLKALLAPFANSGAKATQENFDEVKSYLRKRAEHLLGTSAFYCYQPSIPANKSCIALATDLKTIFSEYRIIKLLIPNVKMIPDKFESKHFNDFVVTEDGYFLGVMEGLDAVRNDKRHYYYHPAKHIDKDGELERLDPDLLVDHSTLSWHYAMLVGGLIGKLSQEDILNCDKAKTELAEFIAEGKSSRRTPAHKDAGKKRLMLSLTSNIHSLNALAEFLDENVHLNEWEEFLQSVGIDELCRIVIPMRKRSLQKAGQSDEDYKKEQADFARQALEELISSPTKWPTSDNAKHALCYIFTYLKHDLRDASYDYNTYTTAFFGRAGSSLFGQKSKDEAKSYTQAFKEFLLSNQDMRDVEKFILSKKLPAVTSGSTWYLQNKIIDAGRNCANVTAAPALAVGAQ